MIVLAGDIGGTKTLLALFDIEAPGSYRELAKTRYESRAHQGLSSIVAEFLDDHREFPPAAASFGIAGPVVGDVIQLPNLPWVIERKDLIARSGLRNLSLINDFAAIGYGLELLGPADLHALQPGKPEPHAPIAVLGAGTGLGQAYLIWQDGDYRVYPSEGGHCTFAPQTDVEYRLHAFLARTHGHVSFERLLSGQGLWGIYRFLASESPELVLPTVADEMQRDDPAAVISRRAIDQSDALCGRALDLFVSIYGAEAGNLALKLLARGGVFVAGGIAPRLIKRLDQGDFIASFRSKGRLSSVIASIPVHVVLNPEVGLLGAAAFATRLTNRKQ